VGKNYLDRNRTAYLPFKLEVVRQLTRFLPDKSNRFEICFASQRTQLSTSQTLRPLGHHYKPGLTIIIVDPEPGRHTA
jgi:hypothetical protein